MSPVEAPSTAAGLAPDLAAALEGADVVVLDPGVAQTAWGGLVQLAAGGRVRLASAGARIEDVVALAEELRGAESVVAVGGGATVDLVKLAGTAEATSLEKRARTGRWGVVVLPDEPPAWRLTAVPTTLGTGAEASAVAPVAVGRRRRLVIARGLRPAGALYDARALQGLGDGLIADGLLEIGLRLVGPFVVSAGGTDGDQRVLDALAELEELAPRARGRDVGALAAAAALSARCHTAEFTAGRRPFAWPLWYLANELASAAALTKMEASRLLLAACVERLRGGAPGWGDPERLRELESGWAERSAGGELVTRLAAVAGDVDPAAALWARHEPALAALVPGGLAMSAFRAWGGPGNALSGVPLVDLEHLFGTVLGRPAAELAAHGGRLTSTRRTVTPVRPGQGMLDASASASASKPEGPTPEDYLGLLAPEHGLSRGHQVSAVDVGGPHLMAVIADVGMRVAGAGSTAVVDDMAGAMGQSIREVAPRAVGEAVERHALAHPERAAPVPEAADAVEDLGAWPALPASDGTSRRAGVLSPAGSPLPTEDWSGEAVVSVPSSWVDFPAAAAAGDAGSCWEGTPSGAAAHLGRVRAVDAALNELVERDAVARAWWAPQGVHRLDLEALDPRNRGQRALRRLVRSSPETRVHRVPSAVPGVHGYLGWVLGPEGTTACGVGVSDDDVVGAERALREAWQIRHLLLNHSPSDDAGRRDDFHGMSVGRMSFWASAESREALTRWERHAGEPVAPRRSGAEGPSGTAAAIRDAAREWDVVLVDLTPRLPEAVRAFGFHAVKAVAAQLQPLVLDEAAPWALLPEVEALRRQDCLPMTGLGPGRDQSRGWQPLL